MKRKNMRDKGSITIEACIALTLFMFLILTLYSFFYVFEAQMKIKLNLVRTAESMSVDPFVSSRVDKKILGQDTTVSDFLASLSLHVITKNESFLSEGMWYKGLDHEADDQEEAQKEYQKNRTELVDTAKTRFVALYNGGDEAAMVENLKMLRVVDGNVDLSESTLENGNLKLVASFKLKYLFDYPAFHMPDLEIKQIAVSKIWK